MSTTKKIVTLALFMAIHVIFNTFYIPVTDSLRITFSFLIMMSISAIFDFKTAVLYGLIEDLVAFIVYPSGSFFIGYTASDYGGMRNRTFIQHLQQKILPCGTV